MMATYEQSIASAYNQYVLHVYLYSLYYDTVATAPDADVDHCLLSHIHNYAMMQLMVLAIAEFSETTIAEMMLLMM